MSRGAENSPVVGGNFFITPSQYGLHNDSTRETDWRNTLDKTPYNSERRKYVPWRNIIIPLFTANAELYLFVALFSWYLVGQVESLYNSYELNQKLKIEKG